jgi:hypothetical protein
VFEVARDSVEADVARYREHCDQLRHRLQGMPAR